MTVNVINTLLIILCLSASTVCQSSWQIIDEDNAEMTIIYAIEHEERILVLANKETYRHSDVFSNFIVVLSLDGDTLGVHDITVGEFFHEEAHILIYNDENNTYSVQGEIIENDSGNSPTFWYTQTLNIDFQHLSINKRELLRPTEVVLFSYNSNNNYNVTVIEDIRTNMIFITDHSGNIVKNRNLERGRVFRSVVIDEDDVITLSSDSIVQIDINFNRLSAIQPLPWPLDFQGQKMLKKDNEFYYASKIRTTNSIGELYDLLLLKTDEDFNLLNYIKFPEHDLIAMPMNGLAFDEEGSLYMGLLDLPFFIGDTWWQYFTVSKYDTDLNEEWSTFFSEGNYYFMRGLLPLSDDGVFVYGFHRDLFGLIDYPMLFKFDSSGDISTSTEEEASVVKSIKVLGNPSDGIFRAVLNGVSSIDHQLVFYDTSGQQAHKQAIDQNNIEIDCSHLASGLYYFQVMQGSDKVVGGKWMKQ